MVKLFVCELKRLDVEPLQFEFSSEAGLTPTPFGIGPRSESTNWMSSCPGNRKVHEPLPIQQPSHLLQNLNPPPIVLDQIVERRPKLRQSTTGVTCPAL